MRAVVFEGVERVAVREVPDPHLEAPGDAVVRVTSTAVCGSDLHFYTGKAPLSPGDVMGHEAVGVVESVGAAVRTFEPGRRVVVAFDIACGDCWYCRRGETALCEDFRSLGAGPFGGALPGAQAERVRIPYADTNLLAIPDGMEDERALFVGDVLTTGWYGAATAGINPGDTVAVIGAGPVGFFAAQAAAAHGAGQVLVLDLTADRLELAAAVGATPVDVSRRNAQMAVAETTNGRGADVVIEAVGSVPAFESAVDVVRRGGTVNVVGMFVSEQVEVQLGVFWSRGITVRFAGVCPVHAWWAEAMDAVQRGVLDPIPLISHTLSLEDAPKAYQLFEAREATKVVLKP